MCSQCRREGKFGSIIPTAFFRSSGEQPGDVPDTQASSWTTPGSSCPLSRQHTQVTAVGIGAGMSPEARGEGAGAGGHPLPRGPRPLLREAGCPLQNHRWEADAAAHAPAHRGRAPRPWRRGESLQCPLWCALLNPAPDFPREAQRRGNLRSFPMPGFLGASERRKYVRGPGAAGKFGSGLRSASKISCRVLPPGVSFVVPTRLRHRSNGLDDAQPGDARANIRSGVDAPPTGWAVLLFAKLCVLFPSF